MKNSQTLLIDVGSTYFKLAQGERIQHHFRDFGRSIRQDLEAKCSTILAQYPPEAIRICSSANGGLSTLIVGMSRSFSIKYAVNTAFNSGINIIDTLLLEELERSRIPSERVDVLILSGGVDDAEPIFDEQSIRALRRIPCHNIVHVGSQADRPLLARLLPETVFLPNILDEKLRMNESELKRYLTDLYQADIVGKEEIKSLYALTDNQIYSTPYIVNRALPFIGEKLDVADPFIVIDIGGATTDIHYSSDLIDDNLAGEGGYDRLVFKKLGVYKSRESLVHTARQNEFVFELLSSLNVTEDILEQHSEAATKVLMQLAIFLVLYKVSGHHGDYVDLRLERLNAIVFTGGITKVLSDEEMQSIVHFFYRKLLHYHQIPRIVPDRNYEIWTYGIRALSSEKEES